MVQKLNKINFQYRTKLQKPNDFTNSKQILFIKKNNLPNRKISIQLNKIYFYRDIL